MLESELNKHLEKVGNYIGSFARNELHQIKIKTFPAFLVINLDTRQSHGTHWIALAVYQNEIFICDFLGEINPSSTLLIKLIDYLYILTNHRQIFMTKQLRSINSEFCE